WSGRGRDRNGGTLQSVFHDQARRHRPRSVDQSFDRARTRRQVVVRSESWRGSAILLHIAGGRRRGELMVMRSNSNNPRPTIFIVDDDAAVRDALKLLLRSVGQAVETFGSAQEFLDAYSEDRPGCLVLDIRMPGMSGLELQQKLNERHSILPIIFITGHGDVPMAVEAMQAGAVDFIQKPFRDQDLIDRINQALEKDSGNRAALGERNDIRRRLDTLTPREREVLDLVVHGKA